MKMPYLNSGILSAMFSLGCLLYTSIVLTAQNPELNPDCMIHRYSLNNGSVADVVGDADGISFASPTATTDRFGRPVGAMEFNGSNQYVVVNGNTPIITSDVFSISAWVRQDPGAGGGPGNQNPIFTQRGDYADGPSGDATIGLFSRVASNQVLFYTRRQSVPGKSLLAPAFTDGAWHHYVGVYTATHMLLYLDGELEGSLAHSNPSGIWPGHVDYVNIGRHRFSGSTFGWFDGDIADLRIYDCVLTATDIAQEAANSPCNAPSLADVISVTSSGAELVWSRVPAMDRYLLRGRIAGGSGAFAERTSGRSGLSLSGIPGGTSYEWQVRANCGTVNSPWTPGTVFTTLRMGTQDAVSLHVYPNPVQEQLYLVGSEADRLVDVRLYSADGRELLHERLTEPSSAHLLNLDPLARGSYLLIVQLESGELSRHTLSAVE